MIEGILCSLGLTTKLVRPQAWQNVMYDAPEIQAIPGGGKDRSFVACKLLCPEIQLIRPRCRTPHDGLADSYLIARFGHFKETSRDA